LTGFFFVLAERSKSATSAANYNAPRRQKRRKLRFLLPAITPRELQAIVGSNLPRSSSIIASLQRSFLQESPQTATVYPRRLRFTTAASSAR
jgi:hypothetical protein